MEAHGRRIDAAAAPRPTAGALTYIITHTITVNANT